ncbi:MAG TPA: enoyl-CoA hydratase-related protein [Spongiibacteraceae bacterium]|jgi:enoyl-CoA hydratase/carnithine racemase|nr:enoyl-CoA hydratase-related protein [Spongiibacteraceae bacterium]HUH37325.1 enoyl-CoA hydratase-related protein [Spongiibacteraceae bacterium]
MEYQHIQVSREERLMILTIDRPQVMNALAPQTHAEMDHAFNAFAADDELWAAIVTGSGDTAFCAGGDIAAMQKAAAAGDASLYAIPASGYGGLTSRFDCHKPIIAAVNGLALGGGFEIVLACDLAVASDKASFGLPEPLIGALAVAGGMHRLIRQVGNKRALAMLMTGDSIDAGRALDYGLVNSVVPAGELMAAARKLAQRVLRCSPMAVRASKQVALQGLDYPGLEAAIRAQDAGEYSEMQRWMGGSDAREGIDAFIEKRRPVWKNR